MHTNSEYAPIVVSLLASVRFRDGLKVHEKKLKGMNLQEGATAKDRNAQIGGHKA